jgi:hypothetical protein
MSVSRTVQMTLSAVVQALFSLHAFDRQRKKPTKLVADKGHLRTYTAREALKRLAEAGLVGSTQTVRRAIWIVRKVTGKPSTPYKKDQYLYDAAIVQKLARSDNSARRLLGRTNLSELDIKSNKDDRSFFNSIVKALLLAGHNGLPIYGIASGSFHWWLRNTSRTAANIVIQKLTGQTTLWHTMGSEN